MEQCTTQQSGEVALYRAQLLLSLVASLNSSFAQSQTAMEYHGEIHDLVQVRKESVSRLKTHYPKGRPMTSIHYFVPICVQLGGWDQPRTLMLHEFKNIAAENADVNRWGLSEELLRYNEVSCERDWPM